MINLFHKFALHMSRIIGSVWAFFIAVILIILGSLHIGYTEKWTVESIVVLVTFLMVFFLQHSQNVGEKATHLKLDELIRSIEGARNEVASIEDKAESEIDELKQKIVEARDELEEAASPTDEQKAKALPESGLS